VGRLDDLAAAVTVMATPANRPKLWSGIWSGYAIVIGFGVLAIFAALFDLTPYRWAFAVLVAGKLVTNTVAALALRAERGVMVGQAINTIADVALLTAAIYFTGGPYSPLLATYVIVVAVLALLANEGITILMAGVIVVLFGGMVVLLATGTIAPTAVPGAPGEAPSWGYAITSIAYCALVVGVPAWFSAATLRLLRAKETALEARTSQLVEASAQRSQFVASMTHELRTPIHGVQGLADVIAAGVYGPVTDKQREACASIKRSAKQLLALVDDVLNLTRAEAGRIDAHSSRVDVAALVERVAESVSWMLGTKKLTVDVVVEPRLPDVESDERWLAHVLVNLMANAIKFTPDGGVVTVRAETYDAQRIVLVVRDTGVGIPEEDREAIFEPFRQGDSSDERGFGGVGLGLALVAKLTALLGCEVELDSELGKGTTFRVLVPRRWHGRRGSQMIRAARPPSVIPPVK
jgi:signal transduction histidine kinase